jgi:hypothetical protein
MKQNKTTRRAVKTGLMEFNGHEQSLTSVGKGELHE